MFHSDSSAFFTYKIYHLYIYVIKRFAQSYLRITMVEVQRQMKAKRTYRYDNSSHCTKGCLTNIRVSLEPRLAVQAVSKENASIVRKHTEDE